MAKEKEIKTNAMRILDRQKIKYEVLQYECDEFIDGLHTAEKTGAPVEQSFKNACGTGKKQAVLCAGASDCRGSRPEKSRKSGGGEIHRDDPCQRYHCSQRIRPRRMQPDRNEKTVSDRDSGMCGEF